jgi:hypothetical protein
MTVIKGFSRMSKKVVMVEFKELPQPLSGRNDENYENPQPGQKVSGS